jgi:mono/diheme cytochrome c family protein
MGGVPVLLGILLLSGCDTESYSPDQRYTVRTDPLMTQPPDTDQRRPDRPGQLPLMSLGELAKDKDNPLYVLHDGKKLLDPRDLSADQRAQFKRTLEDLFGTPAQPTIKPTEAVTSKDLEEMRLDDVTLAEGSTLYRRHCLHCHGLTGDGRGPTGPWVNPHPRDYRQGVFKFTSTMGGNDRKPRREDLLRTLRQGVEGTSMPSFGLLPDEQLEALISYVIHLSLRGEVEFDTMLTLLKGESLEGGSIESSLKGGLEAFAERWKNYQKTEKVIKPDPFPVVSDDQRKQSVQRGQQIFRDPDKGGCISCHVDYGRSAVFKYDVWGTLVRPADLTAGTYRGGRRPIDLYWRVYGGINGAGMTSYDKLRPNAQQQADKVDNLWDIVNFLQVLPYPAMRQEYGISID